MDTKSETLRKTKKIALINVRVFDGQVIREPSTVVIDGELIGTDSEGAQVIDGKGGILLPGLIDAHIHLENEDTLRQMSKFGITTGLDMATWPPSKLNNLRNRVGMTDIRSPGVPATSPGSLHSCILPFPVDELVANSDDAKSYIARRIAEGVDYIKIVCDVPGPDQVTLNVLVNEAHKHKKLVIAHASASIPFGMAQDAGADVITHAPCDRALDHEAASRMVAEKRIAVPTLAMMEAVTKPPSWSAILGLLFRPTVLFAIIRARRQNPQYQNNKYENARDSVTAMYHAGVPILAGTDAHSPADSPFEVGNL
ncbi:unnamed protein product [Adineta steineri]|uniref:Amidohydrolase-related domain-containing protein n=1 Tax=Adineta steineri TaxID=433720 RepID=A0A819NDX8_9BILA|nr:unnamed protein product [Adineta steineri]CAF3994364.1 unnamed protein product [Adineta steineri]